MFLKPARRFVLLLLLLALPTQGIAAALSGFVCDSAGERQPAHIAHADNGHHVQAQSDASYAHDDDGIDVHYDNFSCNHLVFVLPAVMLPAIVPDFPFWMSSAHTLPDLFVPERPQRPPLA